MTAALSIPLSSVVTPFEGDPTKFKQWIKEVEKYALMSGKQNHEIPILAYMTCKGSVGDFIKRYFDETEIPSWNDLKTLLRDRFADVIDSQHAIAIMRRTRQFDNECVQLYAERLLQIADDAYDRDKMTDQLVQQQLVDIFCDGLSFDYLRLKILRENPKTLENAIELAMKEQNLRKRLTLRSTDNVRSDQPMHGARLDTTPHFLTQTSDQTPYTDRYEESMKIDHYRGVQCYKCRKKGHKANGCPYNKTTKSQKRRNPKTVNTVYPDINKKDVQCWRCHKFGHVRADCQASTGRVYWRNNKTFAKFQKGSNQEN